MVATVLLVLLGVAATGAYYAYSHRISNTVLESASKGIIYPENPPQIGVAFCYPGYGWVEVFDTSGDGINGTINYHVKVGNTSRLGTTNVSIAGSGRIYFAVPGTAGQTVRLVLSTPKWSATTSCMARRDPDLVLHYTFDKGSGSKVIDHSGNRNDGTIYGANWTSGISGYALSFDGSDDYVDVANIEPNEKTVTLWYNPLNITPATSEYLAGDSFAGGTQNTKGWQIYINSASDLVFSVGNGTNYNKYILSSIQSTNRWYFVSAVHDYGNNNLSLYIDGNLVGSTGIVGYATTGYHVNLGRYTYGSSRYFNGTIDEVRIYDRALSSQEIQAIYKAIAG